MQHGFDFLPQVYNDYVLISWILKYGTELAFMICEFLVVSDCEDTYEGGLEPWKEKLVDALGKRQVFWGFALGLKRFQSFLKVKS